MAEAATAGVNLTREQAQLLNHQSEDCLTLNIYVPHQEEGEFFIFNWEFEQFILVMLELMSIVNFNF